MNPDQLDLARRLAAHPRFRWHERMYARDRYGTGYGTITHVGSNYVVVNDKYESGLSDVVPDLTDAATGGVLWEMAGRPGVGPCRSGMVTVSQWSRGEKPRLLPYDGATLAEACARSLLAEWGEVWSMMDNGGARVAQQEQREEPDE